MKIVLVGSRKAAVSLLIGDFKMKLQNSDRCEPKFQWGTQGVLATKLFSWWTKNFECGSDEICVLDVASEEFKMYKHHNVHPPAVLQRIEPGQSMNRRLANPGLGAVFACHNLYARTKRNVLTVDSKFMIFMCTQDFTNDSSKSSCFIHTAHFRIMEDMETLTLNCRET